MVSLSLSLQGFWFLIWAKHSWYWFVLSLSPIQMPTRPTSYHHLASQPSLSLSLLCSHFHFHCSLVFIYQLGQGARFWILGFRKPILSVLSLQQSGTWFSIGKLTFLVCLTAWWRKPHKSNQDKQVFDLFVLVFGLMLSLVSWNLGQFAKSRKRGEGEEFHQIQV